MEQLEDIAFEINFEVTEKEIEKVSDGLETVKKLTLEISKPMDKLLFSMAQGLQKIESSVSSLTDALTAATSAMQELVDQFVYIQLGNALQEEAAMVGEPFAEATGVIQAAIEGVIGAITSVGIEKLLTVIAEALGKVPSQIAGVVLAILAVIAAITAVIVYWDELVVLFTETIPQFIEQNAALAGSFNGISGAFYDMCQSMVTNWTTHSGSLLLALSTFRTGMEELWNQLITTVIEPAVAVIGELLDNIWVQHLQPLWDKTIGFILSVCETVMILWNSFLKPIVEWVNSIMAPIIVTTIQLVAGVVEWAVGALSGYLGELLERLDGVVQYIAGVFTGDWERAWGGIQKTFKEMCDHLADPLRAPINGIIGLINGLMSGVVSGINLVIKALNQLHFDIPDWVPGLGGKSFGFNLKTVTAPQIPYLAKGAVLPANKPFLAVVGDQKHGTNVEAPLATIQEAVALVMDDHISAMMAGFEALLQEQRILRQTVEGIELGDSVIGRAAQRYNRKMAIVKGGY